MSKAFILVFFVFLSTIAYSVEEDKYMQAALELVHVPEGNELKVIIDILLEIQLKANPSHKPYRKAFEEFYRETLSSDEYRIGLAKIQMELFTHEELIQLAELQRLPVFEKYRDVMPVFLKRNLEYGQEVAAKNWDRLRELIEKEEFDSYEKACVEALTKKGNTKEKIELECSCGVKVFEKHFAEIGQLKKTLEGNENGDKAAREEAEGRLQELTAVFEEEVKQCLSMR